MFSRLLRHGFAIQLLIAAAMCSSWIVAQGPDMALLRKGSGTTAPTTAATEVYMEIRTPSGVLKVLVPTTSAPPQKRLTLSGTDPSEGLLTLSADGQYMVITGYDAPPGLANVATTTSAAVPRVIARIDLALNIDTSTTLGSAFSGVSVRSACTEDGSQFWVAGGNSGIVLAPFGGSGGTTISTGSPTDLRSVDIANGQLHATSGAGATNRGVNTIGTGIPTTAGQSISVLSGMASGTASPYDFWFADPQTLYVADDRASTSGGGLQKWTESGGTWSLAYTLVPGPGTVTVRGLTGIRDQTGTTLWATTTEATANRLVRVVDTGAGSAFVTLATASPNTTYCGIRFLRTPYAVVLAGAGCPTSAGIPAIATAGGLPISGNLGFGLLLANAPSFSIYVSVISIGLPLGGGIPLFALGAPACATLYPQSLDILLAGVTDGAGIGITPLALAPDSSLWGLVLGTQHLPFDPVFYSGFGLPFGNTSGMQLTIGN